MIHAQAKGEGRGHVGGMVGCRRLYVSRPRSERASSLPLAHPPTRLMVCTASDAGIYNDRVRERVCIAEGDGERGAGEPQSR